MNDEKPITPFEIIEAGLGKEDERSFWHVALSVLTDEFLQRHHADAKARPWAMVVGVCSHWVWPHKGKWLAGGGFAWPLGYHDSVPEFDWSLTLLFSEGKWVPAPKLPGKRVTIFRLAIPARTARHRQAVVRAHWVPGDCIIDYGFRKTSGAWRCVAVSDEASRGRILVGGG